MYKRNFFGGGGSGKSGASYNEERYRVARVVSTSTINFGGKSASFMIKPITTVNIEEMSRRPLSSRNSDHPPRRGAVGPKSKKKDRGFILNKAILVADFNNILAEITLYGPMIVTEDDLKSPTVRDIMCMAALVNGVGGGVWRYAPPADFFLEIKYSEIVSGAFQSTVISYYFIYCTLYTMSG